MISIILGNKIMKCVGNGKKCTFRCSPFTNTFFDGLTCRIPVHKVLQIVYWWANKMPVNKIAKEVKVEPGTVIDYCNYLREV